MFCCTVEKFNLLPSSVSSDKAEKRKGEGVLITELDGMYLANDFPLQGEMVYRYSFWFEIDNPIRNCFVAFGLKKGNYFACWPGVGTESFFFSFLFLFIHFSVIAKCVGKPNPVLV